MIELLVVIVIIVVLSGAMAISVSAGLDSTRGQGEAARVVDLLQLAANRAILEGQPHRVAVDLDTGRLQILFEADLEQAPGQFVPWQSGDITNMRLDGFTRLLAYGNVAEIEDEPGAEERLEQGRYVEFRPDGTADEAMMILQTERGETWSVLISGMTGRVRLQEGDAREEAEEP